ncbi:MAG: hypothetical protein NVV60_00380 [Luteimonas sp.]|nr:hypothetical protein [Luteimonas sp.]
MAIFSLFRCGDDTYVAVPEGMTPPIEAILRFGDCLFIRAIPCNLFSMAAWEEASASIDEHLYAVIPAEALDEMFDRQDA